MESNSNDIIDFKAACDKELKHEESFENGKETAYLLNVKEEEADDLFETNDDVFKRIKLEVALKEEVFDDCHLNDNSIDTRDEVVCTCKNCPAVFSSEIEYHDHLKKTHATVTSGYTCEHCGKIFKRNSEFIKHKRVHTGAKPYLCPYCGKTFANGSNMLAHTRSHTRKKLNEQKIELHEGSNSETVFHIKDEIKYRCTCEHCGKIFKDKSGYTKHMRVHTGEKPYLCTYCGKKFACGSNMVVHMRFHSGEKHYKCNKCDKSFVNLYGLKSHLFSHSDERKYQCEICQKAYKQKATLNKHKSMHRSLPKLVTCNICDKQLKSVRSLRAHNLHVHMSGERKFKCLRCEKAFFSNRDLNNHAGIHNVCSSCGKVFSDKSGLRHHINNTHGLRKRKYNCSYCEKTFFTGGNLKVHLRTHTGEKPYNCSSCGRDFSQKSSLTVHMTKVHVLREPKYNCPHCKKAFFTGGNFKIHLRIHTGQKKPYVCSHCGKFYAQKSALTKHLKKIHCDLSG